MCRTGSTGRLNDASPTCRQRRRTEHGAAVLDGHRSSRRHVGTSRSPSPRRLAVVAVASGAAVVDAALVVVSVRCRCDPLCRRHRSRPPSASCADREVFAGTVRVTLPVAPSGPGGDHVGRPSAARSLSGSRPAGDGHLDRRRLAVGDRPSLAAADAAGLADLHGTWDSVPVCRRPGSASSVPGPGVRHRHARPSPCRRRRNGRRPAVLSTAWPRRASSPPASPSRGVLDVAALVIANDVTSNFTWSPGEYDAGAAAGKATPTPCWA